jgi:hypothetical protein
VDKHPRVSLAAMAGCGPHSGTKGVGGKGKGKWSKGWMVSEDAFNELLGERAVPSATPGIKLEHVSKRLQPKQPSHPPNPRASGGKSSKIKLEFEPDNMTTESGLAALQPVLLPLFAIPLLGDPLRQLYMDDLKLWLQSNLTLVEWKALTQ